MSESGVDQCMARLDVAYPHHFKRDGIDADFALQVYHEILDDIDDNLLIAATKQWLSTARPFHPSPGELRDLALSLIERSNGDKSADEAWAEVLNALQQIGYYGVPEWSSEAIAETMKSFGRWKDFCIVEIDQLPTVRAQFLRIYEAQRARRHDSNLMLPEVKERIAQIAESKRHALNSPQGEYDGSN